VSARPLNVPAQASGRSAVRGLALRADAVALIGAGVAFAVLAVLTWNSWGDLARDTGYDWVAASRVADGELPYADFTYYYGPLSAFLLGGVFALYGSTAGVAVGFGLLVAAGAVALTYRLARELTGPLGALVAAALASTCALATGNNNLVTPHSYSASLAVLIGLGTLVAACGYARTGRRSALIIAGAGVGLAALTRPEFVGALAVATGAWLGLRVLTAPAGMRRTTVADLGIWAVAAAAIPLLAYGAILTQVGAGALISDNLFPVDELSAGGRAVLELSAPLTAGSFATLAGRLLVYAAGMAALVALGRAIARGGRARTLALAVVAVAALALAAALAVRPEAVRSRMSPAYGWIPAGAALATGWMAWQARARADGWSARDQAAFLVAAALAVLAAKNYAAFFLQPNPVHAQSALYALPFAAVFLVWLQGEALPGPDAVRTLGIATVAALAISGYVLTARDGAAETVTVRGPGGAITAPPAAGGAYRAALDAIVTRTAPGDPVLLAPQISALYTLSQRRDPLAEISLLPGSLPTPGAEDAVIRRLAGVRVAVTDRRPLREYGHGAFGTTYGTRIGAWIRSHFQHISTLRGSGDGAVTLDLWQRSAP
jgi:hypothetical protein